MAKRPSRPATELVIITGLSGSGKGSVLKALEDAGYYAVDNLPIDLIPKLAELAEDSPRIRCAAVVVDIREGERLVEFPHIYAAVREKAPTRLVFLEASESVLVRRFSETRRPHPLGGSRSVARSVRAERKRLEPIRALSDIIIDTSKFNVHELRDHIVDRIRGKRGAGQLLVHVVSFGYRHGVPAEADLVFDVRFLPNPNYIPRFKKLTGKDPKVAKYIASFPQTNEFISRISDLLIYLLPHYLAEGKSYLTIAFGCTGGHHRSVMIAQRIHANLAAAGYRVKASHRDTAKPV